MQNNKPEQSYEDLWKSQREEQMNTSTDEICARARRCERGNVLGHWILACLAPLAVAWIVHDLYGLLRLHRPLLIATVTWLLVTFCYVVWGFVRNGPRRMGAAEPSTQFLKREFEGRRRFALSVRRWILLLVPAVLAAWWGGGPALTASEMGIKAAWLLRAHQPVTLIVTILVLVFVWFAMGNAARKAEQEIEKLSGC
jgi:uncharacterized RDD family membrane protein YckC